jgi:UDP-sulfoquinovose synthase
MMKILVLGSDGYLGNPTVNYFEDRGHEVLGFDSFWKRGLGIKPLNQHQKKAWFCELKDYGLISKILKDFQPDAIVHYAELASAPYSMGSFQNAAETQHNNVIGTLSLLWAMKEHSPQSHLVKLGTMGEYGSPNCTIPEGYIPRFCLEDYRMSCPMGDLPFPKSPSSLYHLSKVHDTHNILFACNTWGLKATDLMQGVVYGGLSHFHYDAIHGTVINRFCTQAAIKGPLTVYGSGNQRRAFLNIKDTLACVELAALNPPDPGECRVFNQFTETFTVKELAERVASVTGADIVYMENPRVESEISKLDVENTSLMDLGLKPHLLTDDVITETVDFVREHEVDTGLLMPHIMWR